MSKRLDCRLTDEDFAALKSYCERTGASKTGAIRMLIQVLKDERLLAIVRKHITVD